MLDPKFVIAVHDEIIDELGGLPGLAGGGAGAVEAALFRVEMQGVSEFLCLGPFLDLSTAADVACDERPTRWSSRLNIVTQLA